MDNQNQAKKDKLKDRYLKQTYNISLEEYNKILVYQNNSCAICNKNKNDIKKSLAVDHAHKANESGFAIVRGLLCWRCNKALAFFKDNYTLFLAAAQYLNNPPATIALGREVATLPGGVSKKRRKLAKKLKKQELEHGR